MNQSPRLPSMKPFVLVGVVWLFIGMFFIGHHDGPAIQFIGVWILAMTNLICLLKSVATLIDFMSFAESEQRSILGLRLAIWGSLKLTSFFALAGVFVFGRRILAPEPILWGLGTWVLVPLLGGAIAFWREPEGVTQSEE